MNSKQNQYRVLSMQHRGIKMDWWVACPASGSSAIGTSPPGVKRVHINSLGLVYGLVIGG